MEINSNIDSNFISYDFKTRSLSQLSKEKQSFYINCIKNHLSYSIKDYNLNYLSEQDTTLFAFSEESFTPENKSFLVLTLLNMMEIISDNDNYSYVKKQKIILNNMDKGIYNISYKEICAIVNYIISILKSVPKKKREKIFYQIYFEGEIPDINLEIYGVKLQKVKVSFDSVKEINICISNKLSNFIEVNNRSEINLFVVKLFLMFFKAFFKNVLFLNLDLNVYEINNYFNKESNPYNINGNMINKIFKSCEKIFMSNLIILKDLSKFKNVNTIKYILYDSYYLEFYQIISKLLKNKLQTQNTITSKSKEEDENIQTFINKIIYFDYLIQKQIKPYLDFTFEINSLDPFLFLKMNLLIHQYTNVINTSIIFFKQDNINMRKILLNGYYFNNYLQEKDKDKLNPQIKFYPDKINEVFENDYKIYYNHINNINNYKNKLLLKDEEIPNELFPHFNYNLNILFFVLMQKFKSDKNLQNSLSLNFQTNNNGVIDIHSYNNYNCAILSFLFNLFSEIESNPNLESICSLELYLDDLCDKKEYIIKHIFNTFRKNIPFDFKKINLNRLVLDIPNITMILPFENFPCNNLNQLSLKNLSINDLENIANTLLQKKQMFKRLTTLDLGLGYMLEDYKKFLEIILSENICKKLINFSLEIPSYVRRNEILDIFLWIKKCQNKSTSYYLKLSCEDLNYNAGNKYFFNTVNIFKKNIKKEMHKRNLFLDIKCSDNKNINIKMKTLDKEQINFFLKFIFCFQNIYDKKDKKLLNDKNRAKIFENIFYYIGKFSKNEKMINIEVV